MSHTPNLEDLQEENDKLKARIEFLTKALYQAVNTMSSIPPDSTLGQWFMEKDK